MEILSIGEKIKRARIIKNCTLKELCGDKISISKMSCIENGKVIPEAWITEFIAEKLDIDRTYLEQGVREQVESNIIWLNANNSSSEYEKRLEYNLEFAIKYAYFDLAFELMHMLFEMNMNKENKDGVLEIAAKYYDVCNKSSSKENYVIYYGDMAKYFYFSKEYGQAANYYYNITSILQKLRNNNKEEMAIYSYKQALCYIKLKRYNKAYSILNEIKEIIECIKDEHIKAEIYNMFAKIALMLHKENFEINEQKTYEHYSDDKSKIAEFMYEYAEIFFDLGLADNAKKYIKRGLDIHPTEDIRKWSEFILSCVEKLLENNVTDEVKTLCDEALNNAINLDDIILMEKGYYLKSKIYELEGSFTSAEMYMNFSLDFLLKFGTSKDKYDRYIEMGTMYYKLGQDNDAIKYFCMSLALEKRM